jgi:hypothetical protein
MHEEAGQIRNGSYFVRSLGSRLEDDFKCLLRFSWRFPCEHFSDIKTFFRQNIISKSTEEMVYTGMVQQFLARVLLQRTDCPWSTQLMAKLFCLGRAFRKTEIESPNFPEMVNCQRHGTSISNVIHLLRAGLFGFIATMLPVSEPLMPTYWADQAQILVKMGVECEVINTLSPMVADMKKMHNRKPTQASARWRPDGSLIVGQHIFLANRILSLIPATLETAEEIFEQVFENACWCLLKDSKVSVNNNREAPHCAVSFSWIAKDGQAFDSTALKLKNETAK